MTFLTSKPDYCHTMQAEKDKNPTKSARKSRVVIERKESFTSEHMAEHIYYQKADYLLVCAFRQTTSPSWPEKTDCTAT